MEITWFQALFVAIVAYLAVSVWPFGVGYFTLYRPLIGGTLVGLILGDVQGGMAFGAALNAVHLGFVSTGGSLPSDLVTAGYIGTALALTSGMDVDAALVTFGIPLGVLGSLLWFGRMTLGSAFAHWADARAERGDVRGVAAINLWAGQGLLFVFYALPTFVIVFYGPWAIDHLLPLVPGMLIQALSVVGGMLPALGIALLLRSIGRVKLLPHYLIGLLLSTYLELPIQVIALLGAAVAMLLLRDLDLGAFTGTPTPREATERVPRHVLWGAWVRWVMFLHSCYNYERLQGLGFAHALRPVIEHLYVTTGDRAAALKRHLVFFNSEPQFGALVPAAVIAMEEERAAGAEVSDGAILSVKSGLMGPLAGVGDSLIQGTVTPLLLSMGIGLALEGNLAGTVLYAILISVVVLGSSYTFWSLGYRWGKAAVARVLSSGWIQALTEGAAVVGMTVLGGLTATVVQFSTPASFAVGEAVISLQEDVLDAVLRGVLPLSLTLFTWWMLSRRVSSMWTIAWLAVLGIDLTYLGLAGWSVPPLLTAEWVAFVLGGTPVTLASALAHLWPPILATAAAIVGWRLRQRTRRT